METITTKNNKLIAQFMGYTERIEKQGENFNLNGGIMWSGFADTSVYDHKELQSELFLKYNMSWDWLMKVVDKIESLGYDSRINGNNSDGGFLCDFVDIENKEMACEISYVSKIDAVYSAVVEFIKVHNYETTQA